MTTRRYKIDVGDWVARRNRHGEWVLAGKVIDADDESGKVRSSTGVTAVYSVGEDPIARVRWIRRGRWTV